MSPGWREDCGQFLQCVLLIILIAVGVNLSVTVAQHQLGPHAAPCCDDAE